MPLQNIAGELENLQQSLTATEIAVSSLPSDSLQNMLSALLVSRTYITYNKIRSCHLQLVTFETCRINSLVDRF